MVCFTFKLVILTLCTTSWYNDENDKSINRFTLVFSCMLTFIVLSDHKLTILQFYFQLERYCITW